MRSDPYQALRPRSVPFQALRHAPSDRRHAVPKKRL